MLMLVSKERFVAVTPVLSKSFLLSLVGCTAYPTIPVATDPVVVQVHHVDKLDSDPTTAVEIASVSFFAPGTVCYDRSSSNTLSVPLCQQV
jgi:hypothetical protein